MIDKLDIAGKVFKNQIERRPYAFGVWLACLQADLLGLSKLSVFEFGVAHGHGLLNLCEICKLIHESTGFEFQIFGFDSDIGMPPLLDYRDHPEVWHEGEFLFDHEVTKRKLPPNAELIVGSIAKTLSAFLDRGSLAEYPVGFVSIDVDLYSSTCDLLKLFEVSNPDWLLPATIAYLDDINDLLTLNSWCGEALAIREFNDRNPLRKLEEKRIRQNHAPEGWHDHIYCCHALDHPARNGRRGGKPLSINITAM